MDRRIWLQCSLSGALVIVFIISVVIGVLAVGKDGNKKAGILTLQFNLTSILSTLYRRSLQDRNLIKSIDFNPTSIASILETALPDSSSFPHTDNIVGGFDTVISGVASQVQSAANSIATIIPPTIEARFPKNCSIGTSSFCIGLANNLSCQRLPPNLSNIIPSEFQDILQGFDSIDILNIALAKLTTLAIRDFWIIGLVLCFIILLSSLLSLFGYISLAKIWKVVFSLVVGLILCALFIVPLVILRTLHSQLGNLPGWIEVIEGEVTGLLIGGLCCAIVLILSCAAVLTIF